ncbi:hypothetical protein HDK77DRAFT_44998 [Phyllosticta capitalensis]
MRTSILLSILAAAVGTNACALYVDCKCHDSTTGLQNDAVTQAACKYYNDAYAPNYAYSDTPHHQCTTVTLTSGPINNCQWDNACKLAGGPNMYQYCYNKFI